MKCYTCKKNEPRKGLMNCESCAEKMYPHKEKKNYKVSYMRYQLRQMAFKARETNRHATTPRPTERVKTDGGAGGQVDTSIGEAKGLSTEPRDSLFG